jgi:hypothetical protein
MARGNGDANMSIGADLAPLERALATMPGHTEKSAKALVDAFAKHLKRLPKDAEKAAREAERQMNQRMMAMRQVSAAAFGGIVNDLADVGEAFGPAGLAAAGLGLGLAAVAVGVVKAEQALAAWMITLDDSSARMERLGLLTRDQAAAVREAATAARAQDAAYTALSSTLGAQLAPELDKLFTGVTDVGIAMGHLDTIEGWRLAIIGVAKAQAVLQGNMAQVTMLERLQAETTGELGEQTEELQQRILAEQLLNRAQSEANRTRQIASDYERRQATAIRDTAKAERDAKRDLEERRKAEEEFAKWREEMWALQGAGSDIKGAERLQLLKMEAEQQEQIDADMEDGLVQQQVRVRQASEERQRLQQDILMSGLNAAAELAQAEADRLEEGTAGQRRAAMMAWAATRASALAGIGVRTWEAFMAAQTIPPPAGQIFAVAALGAGAMAAAGAMKETPSFHVGGLMGSSSYAPDELKMTRAEAALTGAGVAGAGGRAGVEALNRGEGGAQSIAVNLSYGHRHFDAVVQDAARMPTSSLRRAIRTSPRGRVGHRTRR